MDVEECYTSPFELLADPIVSSRRTNDNNDDDANLYKRAYRVDDTGRSMLIDLARSHGSCGTCTGNSESESTPIVREGFRAEIYGTVIALSSDSDDSGGGSDDSRVPVLVQVTDAKRSNNQATICGVTKATTAPAPTKATPAPAPQNDSSDKEIASNQPSNDTGITVLSAIVVLMASALAVMSLYFAIVGSPNATKATA